MTSPEPPGAAHVHAREIAALLASQHVELDRDVLPLDEERWMIHGNIAYAGEVIAAVFASEHEAWAVFSSDTDS